MGERRQNVRMKKEKKRQEWRGRRQSTDKRGKEGVRETEIDKDRVKEGSGDREATGAKMTWIHKTSIDYSGMRSQRKRSA